MRVKEIRKIVLFIGIGIIKKGRGISQGKQYLNLNFQNYKRFDHLGLEHLDLFSISILGFRIYKRSDYEGRYSS